MERFPEFVANHLFLFSILSIILGLLIWNLYGDALAGVKLVAPSEATQLINHEQAVVIDVRSGSDYSGGHIINALHLPVTELSSRLGKFNKYRKQAVIMYCTNGAESSRAARTLMQEGFEKIYCLKGGVLAWKNANLPLTRESGQSG